MKLSTKPFALTLMAITLSATLAACGKPTPPADTAPAVTTPPPTATTPSDSAVGNAAATEPIAPASTTEIIVPITLISEKGLGADAGTVAVSETAAGLQLKTHLKGLPPGDHGFHVHQNPDCGAKDKAGKMTAGEAAGEHFDPAQTGKHSGPDGMGHAGDMPRLTVAADGTATATLIAPRLKLVEVKGRSLMVHAEPDDYAGKPGGARIACGVLPQ
ncbi:MAG: superoxide dismutase family protein [Stagnimonas sp.]|nr:superoxide dismutase family protein [Stagnimonas sp.]